MHKLDFHKLSLIQKSHIFKIKKFYVIVYYSQIRSKGNNIMKEIANVYTAIKLDYFKGTKKSILQVMNVTVIEFMELNFA